MSSDSVEELVRIEAEFDHPSWSAKTFKEHCAQPATRIFGCRITGNLVGFLVAHVVVDEAHILNLGLLKEQRGRGLGRYFVTEVLETLYAKGVFWVSLEVRRSNLAAFKLYQALGFKNVGVRQSYYRSNGEDALVMKLDLRHFLHLRKQAS